MITDALRCSQSVSNILLSYLRMAWLDMALPVPRLQSNLQPVNGVVHHVRHARLSGVAYLCSAPCLCVESTAIFAYVQGFMEPRRCAHGFCQPRRSAPAPGGARGSQSGQAPQDGGEEECQGGGGRNASHLASDLPAFGRALHWPMPSRVVSGASCVSQWCAS
jgi:hypothetical protein